MAIILVLILITALIFVGTAIGSVSDTKYLRWLRKIMWKITKKRTLFLLDKHVPLLIYPLSVFLSLDDYSKQVYVDEGYSAYTKLISNKVDELVKNIINSEKTDTQFRKEEIDEIAELDKQSGFKEEEEEIRITDKSRDTPIMSVFDIVDETIDYYSKDVTRRGINKLGTCMYLTPEGKMCAVGRCLIPGFKISNIDESLPELLLVNTSQDLDTMLKREYRGHSIHFWTELQSLHDENDYWNENGITKAGELKAEKIIKLFP